MTVMSFSPARPLPEVPGVAHRFVKVRGARLHVAQAGEGAPLLLLHGFPQNWYAWRHVIPLLAADHHVICPDFRGFGWSDSTRRGYRTEDRVADTLELMNVLGVQQVQLIAHDWGAWAGFRLCIRQPRRFSGFVALNMMHPWPGHRRLMSQAWRFWYTAVVEYPGLGRLALRHWPAFTRFLLRRGVADPDVWRAGEIEEFVATSRTPGAARAGQALHWSFVVHDIPALVSGRFRRLRLEVPTLIMTGADDVVISPKLLSAAGRHAADLTIEVVPGCGHYLPNERPALVAEAARRVTAGQ